MSLGLKRIRFLHLVFMVPRFASDQGWFCVSKLHAKSPWYEPNGAQGTIGPVERSRAMDLQSLGDPEKPLSPAHRVFASM